MTLGMPRWMTLGSGALGLALIFGTRAEAKLEFEAPAQAVPAKWSDKEVVAVYKFKNTGNTTVKITDMQSSCECTTPKMDKKEYAPGEAGELQAVFAVGERTGPQSKTITLKTNLTDQPQILLSFKTEIPVVPGLDKQLLTWIMGQKPAPQTVTVTLPADMPVEKVEVETKGTTFGAVVKAVAGGRYEVTITPAETLARPGRVELWIVAYPKDGQPRRRAVTMMIL